LQYAVHVSCRVNLKTPQKTILVQLVRTVCCISVLDSYKELARFNVRKLAENELEQQVEQKQQAEVKLEPPAAAAAQEAVKQEEKQDGNAAAAAAAEAEVKAEAAAEVKEEAAVNGEADS
jgi:tRNA acetyltransferase TAN1